MSEISRKLSTISRDSALIFSVFELEDTKAFAKLKKSTYPIKIACDIAKAQKSTEKQSTAVRDRTSLEKEIDALMKIIDKSKTAKMSLWEKYHIKSISAETFKSESEKVDAQVQRYNDDLLRLHSELTELATAKESGNAFVEQFSSYAGLDELTREAVISLVDEVRFFSAENIEVHFNFADEYGKVSNMVTLI